MSLNDTPSGERVHIGFFGRRNAGKSSLVNAITGQELAVVSETRGTTTDPVRKAMELLPIGPVMIVDTPLDFDWDTAMARLATLPRQQEWEDYMAMFQQCAQGSTSNEKWKMMGRMFYLY